MNSRTERPPTPVQARLEARQAAFGLPAGTPRPALEDLDREMALAVTPQPPHRPGISLINDLKLLLAALGAGNSVVPLGDNSRATRQLAEYADSLRGN